jgi:tripeptide aminopeptidase
MVVDREELLDRFLRYVRIDTTANPLATTYPSSQGQWELGRMLVEELRQIGIEDAAQTKDGLVLATVPATIANEAPVLAWNAHLDTSPEMKGADVSPQVLRDYPGGDIALPKDPTKIIRVQDNPELESLVGKTLITTDGTTLLGGDDKAGVAIIMQTALALTRHPDTPHGRIRLLFTCDEEIGRGVERVDLAELGADVCYTLDGPGANTIDVETFSADLAVVTISGINIHPSIAKDRMVNAVRAAAFFVEQLPRESLAPEATHERQGFLHPYHLQGQVEGVALRILLRDFETHRLDTYAALLERIGTTTMARFPGTRVQITRSRQYRNLREGLARDPRAVELAERAHARLGRTASRAIIRGGTDGSLLTERGLPTPNLSSGQHNPHSVLEWVCLDEMQQAAELLVELARVWGEA